jgi:para-nitrobenzyl esterase
MPLKRHGRLAVSVVAAVAAAILPGSAVEAAAPEEGAGGGAVVRTENGIVRGEVNDTHRVFRGLPFAAPPVGELRWQSPEPAADWHGIRDATKNKDRCAQDPGFNHPVSHSEDCLYLNVTTPPAGKSRKPKPVMVWLHGGGFIAGSGANYDAQRLVTTGDVLLVAPNYRLGVMAYFGYPGLAGSGGYGIEDQLASLQWVKRNIAAFGGDPNNVTLLGGSAGGQGTCALLAAPRAEGLFHKAGMHSAPCTQEWPNNGLVPHLPAGSTWSHVSDVEKVGVRVAEAKGCTDPATAIDCLRRVAVKDLLNDETAYELPGPAYGNKIMPISPAEALREGKFHKVPVINGSVRDEGRHFTALLWGETITEPRYQELLVEAFGDKAPAVAQKYRSADLGSPGMAWATVIGDHVWSCQTLDNSKLFARHVPTYQFEFNERATPPWEEYPPDVQSGAYHASEVAYLLDQQEFLPDLSEAQWRLADGMVRYWSRFAHTGTPNRGDLPRWDRVRASAPAPFVQSLATPAFGGIKPVGDLGATHNCDFWASLR